MKTEINGFSIKITENGSVNHPFYLCIYVDNVLVAQKSFTTKKRAEIGTSELLSRALVDVTRKLRNVSKALDSVEEEKINYTGRMPFRGTSHYDE